MLIQLILMYSMSERNLSWHVHGWHRPERKTLSRQCFIPVLSYSDILPNGAYVTRQNLTQFGGRKGKTKFGDFTDMAVCRSARQIYIP